MFLTISIVLLLFGLLFRSKQLSAATARSSGAKNGKIKALRVYLANYVNAPLRRIILKVIKRIQVYNFRQAITRRPIMMAGFVLFLLASSLSRLYGIDNIDLSTPTAVIASIPALYGLLVLIGGYLSPYIPLLNQIENTTYRVLAWAILTGVGFAMYGTEIWQLAITYAITTSLYEVVFKWFAKTKKVS